jgi:16S rRNA (uracil1498-N3)-methyltransferase
VARRDTETLMARLFVLPERLHEETVVLGGEDHRYLVRVLRLRAGDEVVLFDGAGQEARARIERVGPRAAELRVLERTASAGTMGPEVTLLVGIPKGDKMELVVQKATELGVARIVPMRTARSIGPAEVARQAARRQRWIKIAREAARQCGRNDVPDVAATVELPAALAALPQDALRLLFWEDARSVGLRDRLSQHGSRPARIVVAVGPEGGFDADEVENARRAGFEVVGLGPRTLRAETAAMAALAIVGFALGDLG